MEIAAWIGAGLLALIVLVFGVVWLVAMLREELFRAILMMLGLAVVVGWGVISVIYLAVTKS